MILRINLSLYQTTTIVLSLFCLGDGHLFRHYLMILYRPGCIDFFGSQTLHRFDGPASLPRKGQPAAVAPPLPPSHTDRTHPSQPTSSNSLSLSFSSSSFHHTALSLLPGLYQFPSTNLAQHIIISQLQPPTSKIVGLLFPCKTQNTKVMRRAQTPLASSTPRTRTREPSS